ncbi:MAG: nucleoside triphosphate pyrophosphohydrolase [Candidatus Aminicenantales bacterium]
MPEENTAGEKFQALVDILAALRGPGGCPWDREQDEKSIAGYFLEEVYEAVDALYRGEPSALAEELGDVLMEVVFLSRLYEEKGAFTAADALDGINAKMIRRHPHVFGGEKIESSERVLDAWVRQKKNEKKRASPFDGLPVSAPALLAAFQIGQRAAQTGFDWPQAGDALAKVSEELREIEEAVAGGDPAAIEEEIGDGLFALANAARLLKVNPEIALRRALDKFKARFSALQKEFEARGPELEKATAAEMDAVWEEIKKR